MSAKFSLALLLTLVAAPLAAQNSGPAYIVTRLGVDTVAIERYTRTNDRLEGDLVLRHPRVRTIHYVADLSPQGQITTLTTNTRRPGTDPNAPPAIQTSRGSPIASR
jgi:hypothetical protein